MRILFLLIFQFLLLSAGFSQLTLQRTEKGVLIMEKKDSVLLYRADPVSLHGEYERTHYIHPLWNVDGTVLTEDFPADHLHQRGVFWAWHQIWVDGKRAGDGWELKDFTQEVQSVIWSKGRKGPRTLTTEVLWKSDRLEEEGAMKAYLKERTRITVHPRKKNYRKLDFEITLKPLRKLVSLGGSEDEKGYSGFSVRMKLPEDVRFEGSDGEIIIQNLEVKSPGFVNISGTFEGEHPGGVLILDHPDNPGYPQAWILRSVRSMQNIKWPGREPVALSASSPLVLKYSLIVYEKELKKKSLRKLLSDLR